MASHKATGTGRGGRRNGAGRPKNARDKRPRRTLSRDLLARAKAEALELPVDRLLRRLNDASLDEKYRDQLAIAVAPYTAPRLSSVAITKRPAEMSDEEIAQLIGLTEEDMLRLGIGRDKWPRPLH
jgi:hypothetical protein